MRLRQRAAQAAADAEHHGPARHARPRRATPSRASHRHPARRAPLKAIHDRAPVVIWQEDRKRWLTVAEDVTDLIGVKSPDRFDVQPCVDLG